MATLEDLRAKEAAINAQQNRNLEQQANLRRDLVNTRNEISQQQARVDALRSDASIDPAILQAAENDLNLSQGILQGIEAERTRIVDQYNDLTDEFAAVLKEIKDVESVQDPTTTIKTPSATNPSKSDAETQAKYENSNSADNYEPQEIGPSFEQSEGFSTERTVPGVAPGAEAPAARPTPINFRSLNGREPGDDLRVKIRVPKSYLNQITNGNGKLTQIGGVLFPYTPSISFEVKADYSSSNPIHSNFPINFYQRSSISPISITGKFTVENDEDAAVYVSTIQLLKALTRMRFASDPSKGSPPPVCRLDAYGPMMLKNVPVSITSFRVELNDSVDYYAFKPAKGLTSVPTLSTISVTCLPMYSRREMQSFSVTGYLSGDLNSKGFV
jgi:hypothetical protein